MKKIKLISLLVACIMLLCVVISSIPASAETVMIDFKPVLKNAKIYGIPPETTVKTLKYAFYGYTVEITDLNKKAVTDNNAYIGSGYLVKLNGVKYTAIVTGDVDSDGELTMFDYSYIKGAYLEQITLNNYQRDAAQVEGTEVRAINYVMVKRYYFGTYDMNSAYTCDPYDPVGDESGWTSGWV